MNLRTSFFQFILPGLLGFLLALSLMHCESPSMLLELPALFTDHMVLQREAEVSVWGKTGSGGSVSVRGSWGAEAEATADAEGNWMASLSTPEAGGPYELRIDAGDTAVNIQDVMIGEVWLASGQSNMEMPLKGWPPNDPILNSAEEIQAADDPDIRMFTVQRTIATTEQDDCIGSWAVCSPETAGDFSATAYFFGRELHQQLGMPIGLIHSSWGGTPAESWTSQAYLADMPDFAPAVEKLELAQPQAEALQAWLDQRPRMSLADMRGPEPWESLDLEDLTLATAEAVDEDWPEMNVPGLWEQGALGPYDGVVWLRKEVELPDAWRGKALTLSLGPVDDMDRTFVNGEVVGGYEQRGHHATPRVYALPASLTNTDRLIVAVRVIDTGGGGGIWGSEDQLHVSSGEGERLSLAGSWKYLPVGEIQQGFLYQYGTSENVYAQRPKVELQLDSHTPSVLYNGMIAPLVPYTVRGAIWYQGESNVGRAEQYERLFPGMIESWRDAWQQEDLSFYYVQIAPYKYDDPASSRSAELRDAQRKSLSTPHTGMAVTLDIGNVDNIHPANKQDVGRRLALWALARDYGMPVVYTGPLPLEARRAGNAVRVSFEGTGGGLKAASEGLSGFELAGENAAFVPAQARIEGDEVQVRAPGLANPRYVRYAFTNGAEAALFNEEGLPATSFELEVSPP